MILMALLILLFAANGGCAQEVVSWQLGTADGLPSSMVYDLLEDESGRIWMATPNGLAHFNGSTVYRLKSQTVISDISYMQLDASGSVWCTDFQKTLYQADIDSVRPMFEFKDRIVVTQKARDSIYIQTKRGAYFLDERAKRPKLLHGGDGVTISYFAGNVYLAMGEIENIQHLPTQRFIPVSKDAPSSAMDVVGNEFVRYYYDTGTVVRYNGVMADTVVAGLARPGSQLSKLVGVRRTSAGLWILSYDGAYLVDENRWFFGSTPVSDVVEGRDGTHWFSTLTEGVWVVPTLSAYRFSEDFGLSSDNLNRVLFA